jgi:hypothetical protein
MYVCMQKSFQCYRSRQARRKLQSLKRLLVGGVLVVTSKKDIPFWDTLLGCESSSSELMAQAKYHCYTDPLSKRRKFGAFRIASHDVVLTTFDVRALSDCSVHTFVKSPSLFGYLLVCSCHRGCFIYAFIFVIALYLLTSCINVSLLLLFGVCCVCE